MRRTRIRLPFHPGVEKCPKDIGAMKMSHSEGLAGEDISTEQQQRFTLVMHTSGPAAE